MIGLWVILKPLLTTELLFKDPVSNSETTSFLFVCFLFERQRDKGQAPTSSFLHRALPTAEAGTGPMPGTKNSVHVFMWIAETQLLELPPQPP